MNKRDFDAVSVKAILIRCPMVRWEPDHQKSATMQLIKAQRWMSLEKPLKLNSVCQIVLQTEKSADQQLDVKTNNGSRLTNVSGLNASPPHPTSLPQKVSSLNRCCSLQQGKSRKRLLPFGAPAEDKDERQRAVVTLAKFALAPRWWHFCENWAFFFNNKTKTKNCAEGISSWRACPLTSGWLWQEFS